VAAAPITWDEKSLSAMPAGVDPTLIAESLRLTPAARLARLQAMVDFVEETRRGHPVQASPPGAARPRR